MFPKGVATKAADGLTSANYVRAQSP